MLCVSYRFCFRMVTRLRGLLTVLLVTSNDLLGYQGGKEADKMTSDYVSWLDTKSLGSRTKLEWWPASVCSVGFQFWGGWGIILRRTVMPGGVPLCRQPTKTKQTPLKALFKWAQLLSLQDLLCQGEPRDSSDSWGIHKCGVLGASEFLEDVYQKLDCNCGKLGTSICVKMEGRWGGYGQFVGTRFLE